LGGTLQCESYTCSEQLAPRTDSSPASGGPRIGSFLSRVPISSRPFHSPLSTKKKKGNPRPPSPSPGPSYFPGLARVTLSRGTVHRRSPRPLSLVNPPSPSLHLTLAERIEVLIVHHLTRHWIHPKPTQTKLHYRSTFGCGSTTSASLSNYDCDRDCDCDYVLTETKTFRPHCNLCRHRRPRTRRAFACSPADLLTAQVSVSIYTLSSYPLQVSPFGLVCNPTALFPPNMTLYLHMFSGARSVSSVVAESRYGK
jgi:hypothetical protein